MIPSPNLANTLGLAGNNLERWYQYISSLDAFKVSVGDLPSFKKESNQNKSGVKDNKAPAKDEGGYLTFHASEMYLY